MPPLLKFLLQTGLWLVIELRNHLCLPMPKQLHVREGFSESGCVWWQRGRRRDLAVC